METKKKTVSLKTFCIICGSISVSFLIISNAVVKLPYTITNYFNLYDLNSAGIAFATVVVVIWLLVGDKLLKWDDRISWR
jgi:hypothetical protein